MDATEESGRYGRLLNHSKRSPNCKTIVVEIEGTPRLTFVARRDITAGEEILFDYGDR